jgi:hypothetical protein
MKARTLAAVVRSRLRAERRTGLFACAAAAIVGFVQPHGIAAVTDPQSADLATRGVWLAGPMFFCSTIGIAVALMQGPGRHPYLDVSERSAPLFGRELARAKALAPAAVAALAALACWAAQWITGFAAPPTFFALALACVLASTLTALGATLRRGGARWLYTGSAFAVSTIAYVFAVYADAATTKRGDAVGVASELVFCLVTGFVALRQYGETLARYDV